MRKGIAKVVAWILLCAAACAWASADPAVRGDSGEGVTRLQERLYALGFLDGKIDGKYGPATSQAVLEAKKVLNARYGLRLSENGDEADAVTVGYLYASDTEFFAEKLSMKSDGSEVLRLQRVLCQAGYLRAESKTGAYDAATYRAVCAFQKENGFPATGIADEATQLRLYSDGRKNAAFAALSYGDSGDAVKGMQEELWRLGYLEKEPDGQFGPGTRDALALYVQENLGDAGFAGDYADVWMQTQLKNSVFSFTKSYEMGDKGKDVARIVRLLTRQGYYDGAATEELSSDIMIALQYFQQTNRLPITGQADRDTQELLYSGRAAGVETPAPRTVNPGESGAAVKAYQDALVSAGFLAPPVSGTFDGDTEKAAKAMLAYLTAHDYPVAKGWAAGDARAQMLLKSGTAFVPEKMTVGASGPDVERVQRRLNSLGYLSRLKVDGKYGDLTQTAIMRFQETNGLNATGNCDRRTLAALFSLDAEERKTAWRIQVSIDEQKVYVYQLRSNGKSYKLYKTMTCSTGLNDATPRGVFAGTTGAGERWHHFEEFDCWAQYAYYIEHDIMFHSVIYSQQDEKTLRQSSVNALGYPASHGCVRLSVADAEWIYTTCPAGTVVTIY